MEDFSNTELFSLENSRRDGFCVVIENPGGKVTFYASLTARLYEGNGFRVRYAAVDKSRGEGKPNCTVYFCCMVNLLTCNTLLFLQDSVATVGTYLPKVKLV